MTHVESNSQRTDLPHPHPAVVFQTVSEGAVLLNLEQELYYGLNGVGARVWQLLEESRDMDDLCARMGREYPDVSAAQLRADVDELLTALEDSGLLVAD